MRTRGVISSYSRAQPRMAFGFYKRHKRTKAWNRKPLPLQSLLPIATILSAQLPIHISSMHFHISSMELTEEPPKKRTQQPFIYIIKQKDIYLFQPYFCGSKFKITDYLNIIIDLLLYIFICLDRYLSILLFICFDNIMFVYVFILLFLSIFICLYFYSCTYFFICVYICLCSKRKYSLYLFLYFVIHIFRLVLMR